MKVNSYINTEEESRKKRIIWEELNKEYIQVINASAYMLKMYEADSIQWGQITYHVTLQEQAAKEAAAAALNNLDGLSDDVQAAYELAAAAAAAVAKSREVTP